MTVQRPDTVTCALCGADSTQMMIFSTNAFGSPDLDLRPPTSKRDTMRFWLQECPDCAYVAEDISEAENKIRIQEVMRSDGWTALMPSPKPKHPPKKPATRRGHQGAAADAIKQILARTAPTQLAGRFLRRALIEAALGDVSAAGWATLHAAWSEDDNGHHKAAASNRRAAAGIFRQSLNGASGESEEAVSTMLIMIDALRRSDQWDESLSICRELEHGQSSEQVADVVRYQKRLIEARDNACHLVADAEAADQAP